MIQIAEQKNLIKLVSEIILWISELKCFRNLLTSSWNVLEIFGSKIKKSHRKATTFQQRMADKGLRLFFLLALISLASVQAQCPAGYGYIVGMMCYKFGGPSLPAAANTACIADDASLVVIKSDEQYNHLVNLINIGSPYFLVMQYKYQQFISFQLKFIFRLDL